MQLFPAVCQMLHAFQFAVYTKCTLHNCKTLFFRHILISRFPYVENSLHFNFTDFPVNFIKQFVSYFFWCPKKCYYRNSSCIIVYIKPSKNIAYNIMEEFIFYADKIMVMGNSKNLHVFNFAILLKSRKFYAREIYMFYSNTLPI